jgi:stringent starvation protein B
MIDDLDTSSTRPYLIRALYEWCTDNGLTPYLAVSVDESVQVPREYVKDGAIVLNISFDATGSLKLGNDFIEFKGRFSGVARDILVPVSHVTAIYAKENGQGMAFPFEKSRMSRPVAGPSSLKNLISVHDIAADVIPDVKAVKLAIVESERRNEETNDAPDPPTSPLSAQRPMLKRIK